MLLFAVGAIAFALVRWKRHPRASLMTAVAFAIYLFDFVIFNVFLYWLPSMIEPLKLSQTARTWVEGIIFFCEDFVTATIFILLVAAAFAGRTQAKPPEVEPANP